MIVSNKDYSCKATFFFKETGGLDFQIFLLRVDSFLLKCKSYKVQIKMAFSCDKCTFLRGWRF